MKFNLRRLFLVVLFLFILITPVYAQILNPGFEWGNVSPWGIYMQVPPYVQVNVTTDNPYEGVYSVKGTCVASGNMYVIGIIYNNFPSSLNGTYLWAYRATPYTDPTNYLTYYWNGVAKGEINATQNNTWEYYHLSNLPVGTGKFEIRSGNCYNTAKTWYLDNFASEYIPPLSVGYYSLQVTPKQINYGDSFNMYINSTGGYADIKNIAYGYTKDTGEQGNLYDGANPTYLMDYALIGGIWYQYNTGTNSYSIDKGSSMPNPVSTTGDLKSGLGGGNYIIDCYLTKTDNSYQKISDTLTISQYLNQELVIEAKDYLTGNLVSWVDINVQNVATGEWLNKTAVTGALTVYYPYGTHIFVKASKSGYTTAYKNWSVTHVPYYRLWMIMYRGETAPSNVTLHVSVFDSFNFAPLVGASVLLSDIQYKITSAAGVASFTILADDYYEILVSKTGYQDGIDIINTTGLGGTAVEKSILLQRLSVVTPIPTITVTTPILTPRPTIQPLEGNITPSECKVIMPKNATMLDTLLNNIACAGIKGGANQGYALALMIIFVLGIVGGKWGKGMGVVMGMSSGYVLSLAMGLVPVWTFIAMIIFICLILAVKIWATGDR